MRIGAINGNEDWKEVTNREFEDIFRWGTWKIEHESLLKEEKVTYVKDRRYLQELLRHLRKELKSLKKTKENHKKHI